MEISCLGDQYCSTQNPQLNKIVDTFLTPKAFIEYSNTIYSGQWGRDFQINFHNVCTCAVSSVCGYFSNTISDL